MLNATLRATASFGTCPDESQAEDKEQDPIPTGMLMSSIPQIRGCGRQLSRLIPVRNHFPAA